MFSWYKAHFWVEMILILDQRMKILLSCSTNSKKKVKAHLAEHCMDDLIANREAVSPTLNPTVSNNASDNSPLIWTKQQA